MQIEMTHFSLDMMEQMSMFKLGYKYKLSIMRITM